MTNTLVRDLEAGIGEPAVDPIGRRVVVVATSLSDLIDSITGKYPESDRMGSGVVRNAQR